MPNVVFVAPFLLETTLRFVRATATLPGVRLGLVTQQATDRLPPGLAEDLAAVETVPDALAPDVLVPGIRRIIERIGPIDRLLGALEELQVPLGQVRETLGIPGMDAETSRNFRDKARMKEILQAAGLPCARHRRITGLEAARAFVAEVGYPVIVKPVAGSGSRNTFRVEDDDQLRTALDWPATPRGVEVMLEEFVRGKEHSFDSVFQGGRLVWFSCCHYFPAPLEVLENPWIQWSVLIPREAHSPEYDDISRMAEASLRRLGLVDGLSHMEWFRRPDGSIAISEVGVRPPGAHFVNVISWAHDTDLFLDWARLMVFDRFDAPERPYAAGAAFLRGQGTGQVVAVHGVEEAAREVGDLAVEIRIPRRGATPTGTYDGDGFIIVRHPRTEVVREALGKIIRTIRVELG